MPASPHQILGVSPNATPEEIKGAYRRLARELHPDRTGGDKRAEERLKEVNLAYQALQRGAASASGKGDDVFFGEGLDFGDLFSSLFKSRSPASTPTTLEIPIAFEESLTGVTRQVRFQHSRACPACVGQGSLRGARCPRCRGAGRETFDEEATFEFPPGVATGERVRARSAGAGPVLGVAAVTPSPRWARDGHDLWMTIPVEPKNLKPGGKVALASPYARLEATLPAGFGLDMPLRVSGQGVRRPGSPPGHLWIRLVAEIPEKKAAGPRVKAYRQWLDAWVPVA